MIPELETGGAERTTIDIANALVEAGHDAWVVSEGGRMVGELDARVRHMPMRVKSKNPITIVANAQRLAMLSRHQGIDILHARSRAPAWSAYLAARRTGLPFVTTYHGAYKASTGAKLWYNSVMARGHAVIANSRFTATSISIQFRFARERITVIPRGSDLTAFEGSAEPYDWGLPAGSKVIVQIARLTEWKGQRVALQAISALPADVHLILCGDDQGRTRYTDDLKSLAAELGVDRRVHFVGHVDPARALATADICIVPSVEPEAFGRAAVEAQAAGVPVIVSKHGAVSETVLAPPQVSDEKRTGWHVPVGDAEALSASVEHVLSLAPTTRKAHLSRARDHVRAHYSVQAMQEATLRVYASLMD
ncbi:MAG: glycosyltransferase family 4 protein [Pseudomonadota bacterium]